MRISNAADAFDLIAHAFVLQERLALALDECTVTDAPREHQWLQDAHTLVHEASTPQRSLLKQCVYLPELAPAREDEAREEQNVWVDMLEKLQAGIMFHAGSRAPILETLYPKQKLPTLRKASADTVRSYHEEFHKRLKGSYVQRMLLSEDFAFAHPILEAEAKSYQRWLSLLDGVAPAELEATQMRETLVAAANVLWLPMNQARMLAEAALLAREGAFDRLGLGSKPRKRALRLIESPSSDNDAGAEGALSSAG